MGNVLLSIISVLPGETYIHTYIHTYSKFFPGGSLLYAVSFRHVSFMF